VLWSVEDITRDRERQDNAFHQHAARHRLSRPRAGGLLFRDRQGGAVPQLNARRLLGYDLAESSGHVRCRYRPRRRRQPVDARPADGEIRTEIIDIDLVKGNGTSIPVRLLHRARDWATASWARSRTLVLDRRARPGRRSAPASRSVLAVFNDTPFAIATLDGTAGSSATNAPFTAFAGPATRSRSIGLMSELRRTRARAFRQAIAAAAANKSESNRSTRS